MAANFPRRYRPSDEPVLLESLYSVSLNADGRLEAFSLGFDRDLQHIWQTSPGSGWSDWNSVGGVLTSYVSIGRNQDGRLEAFAMGTDGGLWHIWQTSLGGPAWSNWVSLGGAFVGYQGALGIRRADPAVARNADGRLEAFAMGTDGALWHIWQRSPGRIEWSDWDSLGGVLESLQGLLGIRGDPAVAQNADGRLEVFACRADNALWHIWQTSPGGGWSSWNPLGGEITSRPVPAQNADGRLEVFARGTDGALWHIWQTSPGGGWSGWNSLGGGIITDPAVIPNRQGCLQAFALGVDSTLWHIWQTSPGGGWSGWNPLDTTTWVRSVPAVALNDDDCLEVFADRDDRALWHNKQTFPGSAWSGWKSLGGDLGVPYFP